MSWLWASHMGKHHIIHQDLPWFHLLSSVYLCSIHFFSNENSGLRAECKTPKMIESVTAWLDARYRSGRGTSSNRGRNHHNNISWGWSRMPGVWRLVTKYIEQARRLYGFVFTWSWGGSPLWLWKPLLLGCGFRQASPHTKRTVIKKQYAYVRNYSMSQRNKSVAWRGKLCTRQREKIVDLRSIPIVWTNVRIIDSIPDERCRCV